MQRDQLVREGFDHVRIGMTHDEVTAVMGASRKGDAWHYRLSPFSNTTTERDIVCTIYFEGALVSSKDVSYTCIYAEPRER